MTLFALSDQRVNEFLTVETIRSQRDLQYTLTLDYLPVICKISKKIPQIMAASERILETTSVKILSKHTWRMIALPKQP